MWPWALGGIVIGVLVVVSVVVVATVNDGDESLGLVTTTSRAVLSPAQSERSRQAVDAERARIDAINAAKFDRSTYEVI
ncbi:hypothetical protein AZG88_08450 [Rhodococcus sp. LB1]|nr:hypothetical protein AZG88_08450 [Rhodococcus sp. LB1]